ncbi:acylphosphatase [Accumulibacter sp.]|uniref:acylphosphatase n=1 Tax=Accumulibacter sp. TaxID=2053492 RepID=UPI0025D82338|nr:acylphosphatase [Accumulibacter sp.]MCM8594630.1 acylphosphatase [Accumulibacter sp.]MCM8627267.1 acylphosphatase [Accumulibacter sp.]MDS4048776.1 acylphosphatase [Accumulibacter sp.]
MSAREICRNLRVHGRVQGVGYRWTLCAEAERLGLSGWVRNRRDGSVEALVSGMPEAIDALVVWAWRGPSMARVERVSCSEGNAAELGPAGRFRQAATL